MKAAREAWFEGQLELDPEKLIFIDETAATSKMARLYGRARRGERCRAAVPHGHWKTTMLTLGLRLERLIAPMISTVRSPVRPSGTMSGRCWCLC